jgi:transglutaminase-like putative cysteine protease
MGLPVRRVHSRLVVDVEGPTRLDLQVTVRGAATEELIVTSAGRPVPWTELDVDGSRVQVVEPPTGRLEIRYDATVADLAEPAAVTPADRVVFLRPSRYAESDRLGPMAQAEFAGLTEPADLLAAVSSWVGSRLSYVPGSSGPTDGAVDTMLQRQGVCRDYAHLVVALLRALDVPARLVAVYAPGLEPMDFHAVAEAAVGDLWRVVDATLLAPRAGLVRIATGRDAADTAFLSTYRGRAELVEAEVGATIDGPLPADDVRALVSLR